MLLKTILNRVEPFKSFVYGKARWMEEAGRKAIEVEVHARKNGQAICRAVAIGGRVTIGCRNGDSSSYPCGGLPCSSCMPCDGWIAKAAA